MLLNWWKNTRDYLQTYSLIRYSFSSRNLSLDIFCSSKLTVFLKLCSKKCHFLRNIPVLSEKVTLSYTYHRETASLLTDFSLKRPLKKKIMTDWRVCLKFFERPHEGLKWQFSLSLFYSQTCKIPTLLYSSDLKKVLWVVPSLPRANEALNECLQISKRVFNINI